MVDHLWKVYDEAETELSETSMISKDGFRHIVEGSVVRGGVETTELFSVDLSEPDCTCKKWTL